MDGLEAQAALRAFVGQLLQLLQDMWLHGWNQKFAPIKQTTQLIVHDVLFF